MTVKGDRYTRIYLALYERLGDVSVWLPPTTRPERHSPGFASHLHGEDALRSFLDHMKVDGVVRVEGDLLSRYTVTFLPGSPTEIIEALKRRFSAEDAVIDKLFRGEALTESDRDLGAALHSVTVASFSLDPTEASATANAWFAAHPQQSQHGA